MPKRSGMYAKLVDGEDDILGHIAYSVYKNQKSSLLKELNEEKLSDSEIEDKLDVFHRFVSAPEQIILYEEKAVTLSQDFITAALSDYIKEQEQEMEEKLTQIRNEYDEKYRKFFGENRPRSFMYGVAQSVVGAAITGFILVGIYLTGIKLLP
jgi:uncharacterized membrane protein YebE (DUF533 family)